MNVVLFVAEKAMAYVPRYIYDVFVSYAHLDELTADGRPGWVSTFTDELRVALTQELGEPAEVWIDHHRLKTGFKLSEKIRYDLSRTAVLLRLESPSFWQSYYCAQESDWFGSPAMALDPVVLAGQSRLLRAELLEMPGIGHDDEIVARFHNAGKRIAPEAAAAGLASDVARILRDMEGLRQAVYIPRPSVEDSESVAAWTSTTSELKALNYRFTPRTVAAEKESEMRGAIQRARLVVMVIGANAARKDARRRIEIALECDRPVIVWLSPLAGSAADAEQQDLLAWIRGTAGPYELLEKASVERLKERIRDRLNAAFVPPLDALKNVVAEKPSAGAAAKIYLICDPRDRKKGAWRMKQGFEGRGFEVLLPELSAPDAQTLTLEHLRKLRNADRVLLYYHAATRKWFEQQWRELCDDALPWRWRGACLVEPPDKRRWIEEALAHGYKSEPSDKVLFTSDNVEALIPLLGVVK